MKFAEMDLSREMQRALIKAGYDEPTPVQAGLIPVALDEHDVVGQARTGTGKTAAFVIPIIELYDIDRKGKRPQALVMVPTRELAVQVSDEFEKLAVGLPLRQTAIYGGMPIKRQIRCLEMGVDVVIGTPGRIIDHLSRRTLDLSEIDCIVLDEADRMLDIGFRPDIERILKKCPHSRQTLLLSATVPVSVREIAKNYMYEPKFLDFSPSDISVGTIEQFYYSVDAGRKFDLLIRLIEQEDPRQAIIFCRTRRGADKLARRLQKKYKKAGCMHGEMRQKERNRVLSSFRDESLRFMVATDVMGRGIDISSISHIINFDIPSDCDDYVHRVGRTGRMGRDGIAFTFATPDQGPELTKIEMRIERLLKKIEMPDFEHHDSTGPEEKRDVPSLLRKGRGKQRHRKW